MARNGLKVVMANVNRAINSFVREISILRLWVTEGNSLITINLAASMANLVVDNSRTGNSTENLRK